jgi:rRNA maturation protein Nop10
MDNEAHRCLMIGPCETRTGRYTLGEDCSSMRKLSEGQETGATAPAPVNKFEGHDRLCP